MASHWCDIRTSDAGIKWMERIPAHWEVVRLRYLADEPLAYGANEEALEDDPSFPRFVRITDINEDGSLRPDTFKSLPPHIAQPFLLREGDILLARSGATVGKAFIYRSEWGEACFAGYLIRFRCNLDLLLPDFLYAFTQSDMYWSQVREGTIQATIQNFSAEKYGDVLMPWPPLVEQRAIANYLNRETAKLDALIAAKERLLDLLAEKRRALITHAVTRGLDANAPMRDSGVEWLGEIPEHWTVERLRFHLNRIEQGGTPKSETIPAQENEWGVLKVGAVNAWRFNPDENKRLTSGVEPEPKHEIKSGDVLISRANTTELLGSAAIVRKVRPRLLLSDKIYRLVFANSKLLPDYLVVFLRSVAGRYEFERDATGTSSSMQNIEQDSVRNVWIPVPPLSEQRAIVACIETETDKLDALAASAEHTVELLHERRAALIAAAVSGKIRVTG